MQNLTFCIKTRFRSSYQHFKYYLDDINIAFGVASFSCSILTTISLIFLSLSFWIFVCNTIKIFLFSRFREIKECLLLYLFSHFVFLFFSRNLLLSVHWNLNSISAHNFSKAQLLKAFLAVHKFDIVCFSET